MSTPHYGAVENLAPVPFPAGSYQIVVFPVPPKGSQPPSWTALASYSGTLVLKAAPSDTARYACGKYAAQTVAATYNLTTNVLQFTFNPAGGDNLAFTLTAVQPHLAGAAPFLQGTVSIKPAGGAAFTALVRVFSQNLLPSVGSFTVQSATLPLLNGTLLLTSSTTGTYTTAGAPAGMPVELAWSGVLVSFSANVPTPSGGLFDFTALLTPDIPTGAPGPKPKFHGVAVSPDSGGNQDDWIATVGGNGAGKH